MAGECAEERRAALQRQLRSLDDAAERELDEQRRLQAELRDIKNDNTMCDRARCEAERELRCAEIAARRFQLDRLKQQIESVAREKHDAEVVLDVVRTPSDAWLWTLDWEDRQRVEEERRRKRDDDIRTLVLDQESLRKKLDDLDAQRAILNVRRGEHLELSDRSKSTKIELELVSALRERGRRVEMETRRALAAGPVSSPRVPTVPSPRTRDVEGGDIERAMFAEVSPGDLVTPRVDTARTEDAPAPAVPSRTAIELAAEAQKLLATDEQTVAKLKAELASVNGASTIKSMALADDGEDLLRKCLELERLSKEREADIEREQYETSILSVIRDIVLSIIESEAKLIAKEHLRTRDNFASFIRDALMAGCAQSLDEDAKTELALELLPVPCIIKNPPQRLLVPLIGLMLRTLRGPNSLMKE